MRKAFLLILFFLFVTFNSHGESSVTTDQPLPTKVILDHIWILLCAALVFVMQAGFLCLESGLSTSKNSINVAIKNIADFVISVLIFWAFGFGIMFGNSYHGFIGTNNYFLDFNDSWLLSFFLFQAVFAGTAATIDSGVLSGRTKFSVYLIISFFTTLIIYPIFGHWVWGGLFKEEKVGFLEKLGFIDFAGSTVVHSTGAWVGLAGAILIGSRIGRFGKKNSNIRPHNLTFAYLGACLLFFGWFGFNCGSILEATTDISKVAVATILSGSLGCVTCSIISWFNSPFKRPEGEMIINGAIGGLVAVTASCFYISPFEACIIGSIAGIIVYYGTRLLEKFKIDDVVGAIPAHGFSGVWGTLAVALFIDHDFLKNGSRVDQLLIQLFGVFVCFVWAFGMAFLVFRLTKFMIKELRVSQKDELIGLNISEHGAVTDLHELISEMKLHSEDKNFSKHVKISPSSEVAQVGFEYNKVIDKVQEEINNQKNLSKKLNASREEIRAIINSAQDAIVVFNSEFEITDWNPQANKIFGWSKDEVIKENIKELIFPQDEIKHLDIFDLKNLNKRTEINAKHRNGLLFNLEITITAIITNESTKYCAFMRDITDRIKRESDLNKAKEEALASTKAKSEFLAMMSHEIRTPMNGVLGIADLLSDSDLSSSQAEYVATIKNSGKALLTVINDILDFSKIEAGKLDLEKVEFNLKNTLKDVIKIFSFEASKKNISLQSNFDNDICKHILGDPGRIRQILNNFIGNAIKFTHSGYVRVNVKCIKDLDLYQEIKFEIIDTGTGIPKDKQKKLFTPFSQADSSTTREFGGTGLGLAINNKLIELMDGSCGFTSEEGKGSKFFFNLKLLKAEDENDSEPATIIEKINSILLISSNPSFCDLVQNYSNDWNCALTQTDSLEKASQLLNQNNDYNLILIDLDISNSDGFEVGKKIRKHSKFNNIPIILYTSNGQRGDVKVAKEYGFQGYLSNPCTKDQIELILTKALNNSKPPLSNPFYTKYYEELKQRNLNILLAEDNKVNQIVTVSFINKLGHNCDLAINGKEAVEKASKNSYDMILMDMQMPELDGIEATYKIREFNKDIPIIACTANAMESDKIKCKEAGMNGFLSKPLGFNDLKSATEKHSP